MSAHHEIRSALTHIPPVDRDVWLRMGMAVKSELGEDGFEVWDEWSQRDDSYNTRDARSVWRSIDPNGKVTAGTLFHEAKRYGFSPNGTHRQIAATSVEEVAQREKARQAAERQAIKEHEDAAALAFRVWKSALPARTDHPYLERKRIPPVVTLRELPANVIASAIGYAPKQSGDALTGRVLLAPVRVGESLSSLEFIDESGRKSALAGGAKSAGFWSAQKLPDGDGARLTLVLAEGIATALSVHLATGYPAFAALSCGNLPKAAAALRSRYPKASITVCGDLGNGERHAHEAARAAGGLVAFPEFGANRPEGASDFNDLAHTTDGVDAIKRAVAKAKAPEVSTPQPDEKNATAVDSCGLASLELLNCADIVPESVTWLWNGWLAAGKLHVLAGAPGTGKTTIALAIAATLSAGGRWPDGSHATAGDVLIWSGEDDLGDTLAPRLMATGADTRRIHFVGAMCDGNCRRPFDPATDMAALRLEVARLGTVRLLIVDPVVSAVAADSHKNTEVRRALQPLVDLGVDCGCAVLGISHFSKGTAGRDPVERVTGSIAFGAVARIVLAAAKLPDDGEHKGGRLLARAKSNIGPDTGGFGYDLEQVELRSHPGVFASRVLWGRLLDGSARELLAEADAHDDAEERGALADAKGFLQTMLAHGPVSSKQIFAEARDAGHSERTLKRAKKELGIYACKGGMREGWTWQISPKGVEQGQQNSMASFEPLRENGPDREEFTV